MLQENLYRRASLITYKKKKIREPIGFVSIIVEKFFVLTILLEQDVNKILYI